MASKWWLMLILSLAFGLRTFNVNWDDGYHFHPDERWLVMVAERLEWVNPVTEGELFKSVESQMNPKFFAYGSLPIYLLAGAGWWLGEILKRPELGVYTELNLVGRVLSALFDTGTVGLVYLIGRRIGVGRVGTVGQVGIWAALLYAICVLPIQLSHFYTVDTVLTFLVTLTLYLLMRWVEIPAMDPGIRRDDGLRWLIGIGLVVGMAVATKVSAVVLAVPIGVALALLNIKYEIENIHIKNQKLSNVSGLMSSVGRWLMRSAGLGIVIAVVAGLTFVVFEPYAVIDRVTFIKNMEEQGRMTNEAWTFPYTLQYVGTKAYIYPIEQIVKYGMGWGLGLASMLGLLISVGYLVKVWLVKISNIKYQISNKISKFKIQSSNVRSQLSVVNLLIILSFVVVYFAIVGRFAVKFVRYMLPLYPLLCVFAVAGMWVVVSAFQRFSVSKFKVDRNFVLLFFCSFVLLSTLAWTGAFMRVYGQENTRVEASRWMARELGGPHPNPLLKGEGSPVFSEEGAGGVRLGIEHWDDALPVPPWNQGFTQVELPLYEPDTEVKWRMMSAKLEQVDAIVLASNRLLGPLTRIEKFNVTKKYYEKLFNGELGFEKAAEFTNYPGIGPWEVNTQYADESFQVYDHPRVVVFRKVKEMSAEEYFKEIF